MTRHAELTYVRARPGTRICAPMRARVLAIAPGQNSVAELTRR